MKGKKILIPVLLLITLIAIGVTIWALCFRDTAPVLAPDYAPVEEESNAQAIEDDSGEKLEAEEGGGAVSLTYSNEVTIDLSDKAASLVFANPGKSVQDEEIDCNRSGIDYDPEPEHHRSGRRQCGRRRRRFTGSH